MPYSKITSKHAIQKQTLLKLELLDLMFHYPDLSTNSFIYIFNISRPTLYRVITQTNFKDMFNSLSTEKYEDRVKRTTKFNNRDNLVIRELRYKYNNWYKNL
jgi:hypothetical protein